MEELKIEEHDLEKVKALYESIPGITIQMNKFMDYRKEFEPIKKEMRLLRCKTSFLPKDKTENYKVMMSNTRFLSEDYNNSVKEWNNQMNSLLNKYNYISLTAFLEKYPVESIGSNTTKIFSFNIKKMADLTGVQILKSLYSGDPKMTNNYPEKWLLKVYKHVDKISDHDL